MMGEINRSSHPMEKVRSLIQAFAEQGAEEARADLVGYKGALSVPGNSFLPLMQNSPENIKMGYAKPFSFTQAYSQRFMEATGLNDILFESAEKLMDQGMDEASALANIGTIETELSLASEKAAKNAYRGTLLGNSIGLSAEEVKAISDLNERKHLSSWEEPLSVIRARVTGETKDNSLSALIRQTSEEQSSALEKILGERPQNISRVLSRRSSGGVSAVTLDRIIRDSLQAAKVMR